VNLLFVMVRVMFFALSAATLLAQEPPSTPTPTASPPPLTSPAPSSSPLAIATPSETAARSIRISFVPPPLDGKISLGIYNAANQLVRVLHEQADLDEFTTGPDALITRWDGKDDDGADVPPGNYHARGFVVAPMKIDDGAPQPLTWATSVRVKLVANSLENNSHPTVELHPAFDEDSVSLETADGLPLVLLAEPIEVQSAAISNGRENKSVLVQLTTAAGGRTLRVSGIDKMMAFDCGDFELK